MQKRPLSVHAELSKDRYRKLITRFQKNELETLGFKNPGGFFAYYNGPAFFGFVLSVIITIVLLLFKAEGLVFSRKHLGIWLSILILTAILTIFISGTINLFRNQVHSNEFATYVFATLTLVSVLNIFIGQKWLISGKIAPLPEDDIRHDIEPELTTSTDPIHSMSEKAPVVKPVICFLSGELRDFEVPLEDDKALIIGRDPIKSNIILSHPQISNGHVLIKYNSKTDNFIVQNLESMHGVFVNGSKIGTSENVFPGKNPVTITLGENVASFKLSVKGRETEELDFLPKKQRCEAHLSFLSGELAGTDFPLEKGKTLIIGRDPWKANLILDEPKISRTHLMVSYDSIKEKYSIQDLHSRHGVFLNGNRIQTGCTVILNDSNSRIDLGQDGVSILFQEL